MSNRIPPKSKNDQALAVLLGQQRGAGRLIASILVSKLRQVPWSAGTAAETLPMNSDIHAIGEQLCRELAPLGLFELELRPGPDGTPRVIEVNPRIWSRVRLPTVAEVNLLEKAFYLAAGGDAPMATLSPPMAPIGWAWAG